MATAKGRNPDPTLFKSKSKATTGQKFLAVTILVEETGMQNGRARGKGSAADAKKPLIISQLEGQLNQGHYYGYGDWACKAVVLSEDQFKEAYENL